MASRRGTDEGRGGKRIVGTYFLDKTDNLASFSTLNASHPRELPPPERALSEKAVSEKVVLLDPRQEKWIEICDSRRTYQARLEPTPPARNPVLREKLLALFSEEQRRPFGAILDFADLFRRGHGAGPPLGFETRQILDSIALLYRLLEGGEERAVLSGTSLVKASVIAEAAIKELQPLIKAGNISFQNHLPDDLFCQAGHAGILRQSLLNLLLFAVNNCGTLRQVVLNGRVKDSGRSVLQLCFSHPRPLTLAHMRPAALSCRSDVSTYLLEGSDLPLILSRQLLGQAGAALRVEAFPGYGNLLEIQVPHDEAASRGKAVPVPGRQAWTAASHVRVLYIEDNEDHLALMARILQKVPATVYRPASTPELGLSLAHLELPDLILLDIRMPRMNGLELLEILSASARTRHIPVLALSASALAHDVAAGRKSFKRYLTKPFSVREFVAVLEEEVRECLRARGMDPPS